MMSWKRIHCIVPRIAVSNTLVDSSITDCLGLQDDEVDDTDHYGVLSSLTGRIISGVDLADLGSPVHSIIWASKMELIAAVSLAGKEAHRILRFQLEEQEQSWNGKQVEQGSETSGAILQCAVVSGI